MRIHSATIIAVAMFASMPTSALAGKAKELDCMSVDPSIGQSIADKTMAAMDTGGQPNLGAEIQQLIPTAGKCRSQYSWSDNELEAAVTYSVAIASRQGTEAGLRQAGLDPKRAIRAFQSLAPNVRADFTREPIPDSAVQAYISAAVKEKVPVSNETQGRYMGMLAALMAVSETNKNKFLAE